MATEKKTTPKKKVTTREVREPANRCKVCGLVAPSADDLEKHKVRRRHN